MEEYIERGAFIEAVKDIPMWGSVAAMLADSIPAADVAPVVHGHGEQCFEDWRKQIEGDQCSVCGFAHYGTTIRDYKYCPNCGAKMDGEP